MLSSVCCTLSGSAAPLPLSGKQCLIGLYSSSSCLTLMKTLTDPTAWSETGCAGYDHYLKTFAGCQTFLCSSLEPKTNQMWSISYQVPHCQKLTGLQQQISPIGAAGEGEELCQLFQSPPSAVDSSRELVPLLPWQRLKMTQLFINTIGPFLVLNMISPFLLGNWLIISFSAWSVSANIWQPSFHVYQGVRVALI